MNPARVEDSKVELRGALPTRSCTTSAQTAAWSLRATLPGHWERVHRACSVYALYVIIYAIYIYQMGLSLRSRVTFSVTRTAKLPYASLFMTATCSIAYADIQSSIRQTE